MDWLGRQRCARFMRSALWLYPILSTAAATGLAPLVRWVDDLTRWRWMGFGPDGAKAVVGALSSSLLTFIVFAFSILLLAVQMASGLLTPRIIARMFERPQTQRVVAAFAFTWAFSLGTLGRIEDRVPQLQVLLVVVMSIICVAMFFFLVQMCVSQLRPGAIMEAVAEETQAVIGTVYPDPFAEAPPAAGSLGPPRKVIPYRGRSGVVLAFDLETLVRTAAAAGGVVEIVPAVGDFLSDGGALFQLHGASWASVDEHALLRCVALARERKLDRDPAFGFRIITDIAAKALSPAINDPTTGALALDQFEELLLQLGRRNLDIGVTRDRGGAVRVVRNTPSWEDFLHLAVMEIRVYGAQSPQVTRRLHGMLGSLLAQLPPERGQALLDETEALHRTVEHAYPEPWDRVQALCPDRQGFGHRT